MLRSPAPSEWPQVCVLSSVASPECDPRSSWGAWGAHQKGFLLTRVKEKRGLFSHSLSRYFSVPDAVPGALSTKWAPSAVSHMLTGGDPSFWWRRLSHHKTAAACLYWGGTCPQQHVVGFELLPRGGPGAPAAVLPCGLLAE